MKTNKEKFIEKLKNLVWCKNKENVNDFSIYAEVRQMIAGAIYLLEDNDSENLQTEFTYSFLNKKKETVIRVQFFFLDYLYRIDFVNNTMYITIGTHEWDKFCVGYNQFSKLEFKEILITSSVVDFKFININYTKNFNKSVCTREFFEDSGNLPWYSIFKLLYYMGIPIPYYRDIIYESYKEIDFDNIDVWHLFGDLHNKCYFLKEENTFKCSIKLLEL